MFLRPMRAMVASSSVQLIPGSASLLNVVELYMTGYPLSFWTKINTDFLQQYFEANLTLQRSTEVLTNLIFQSSLFSCTSSSRFS